MRSEARPTAERSDGAPPTSFREKVVALTGASSGLGAALARALSKEGARLALFARSEDRLREVAAGCAVAGVDPLVVAGDVVDPDDCRELADRTAERFGRLDHLIACAGVGMWARFDEVRELSIFRRIMEVNYLGLVHSAAFALPHLKRSRGMLVAISSLQGKVGVPFHTGYAASKHAVQGFCDSLRMELRGTGVDVLTVLPTWIRDTRLRERAFAAGGAPRGEGSPRHGSGALALEEVVGAVLKAIDRRERILFLPRRYRYLACLESLAPGLVDRLVVGRVRREAADGEPSA